jgi:dolichyl-phosphate beta-glucosyltransferase
VDLSIVIPAFREVGKITRDIEAASAFLQHSSLAGEIIVVDDGSDDGTADAASKAAASAGAAVRVIRCEPHRGKGYAIRTGIVLTQAKYVMFADSGCCVPYENVLQGLQLLQSGACDIAHGSRKLPSSHIARPQSLYRRICSYLFHRAMICWMKLPTQLTDSQCGFKIYRGEAARTLYRQCTTDGFMFDVELILRAKKAGYVIQEFPIQWSCDRDSRLSPTRSFLGILAELVAIRRALADR